jgi:uncharacterized protein (TIGR03790 family)
MTTAAAVLASLVAFHFTGHEVRALSPDEIALVVNRSAPEGAPLARFYAQARNVPLDRIIELDLPAADDIAFDAYERDVVPPLRQFLRSRGLESKVRCLVTFLGVPLRVAERTNSPRDENELARLREQARRVTVRLGGMVGDVERGAAGLDPSFRAHSTAQSLDALAQRAEHAGQSITTAAQRAQDPQVREKAMKLMLEVRARFAAPVDVPDLTAMPTTERAATRDVTIEHALPTTSPTQAQVNELLERPNDPAARRALRELTHRSGGIFSYARVILGQIEYLTADESAAALDSELSLLWWPTYGRSRWQPNLLNAHFREATTAKTPPPVLMVMRLDGTTPQKVRDMIADSVGVEREGLQGKLVVDARGLAPPTFPLAATQDLSGIPFSVFDQRLRDLAAHVQSKSSLQVLLDEKPEVLPANSVEDVALYCGWYSVRNYVPSMKLNRGAVGFHVASFELLSLRAEGESGWVRGLLNDGAIATLGPVAEPYLHTFPAPDEFFPLLLTGRMTLAEVYWTTTPMASWRMSCIGDPLYNPYARNPQMKVHDLPALLRQVLESAPVASDHAPTTLPRLLPPAPVVAPPGPAGGADGR